MADFKIKPSTIEVNYYPIGVEIETSKEGFPIDATPATNQENVKAPSNWDDIQSVNKPDNNANRREIFTQDDAPTKDFKEGDIWFDTDDNNHIYVANSALAWVSQRDGTIVTAAGTANWSEVVDDDSNKPESNADVTGENQADISGSNINNDSSWTDDTTANTAVTNASTAQSAAEAAQSDATQSLGELDDIALDTKITPVEKLTIKPIWDDIVVEGTATTGTIPAQAIVFSVATTNFDTAYAALDLYLNTTITVFGNMATTTTITRADWDTAWKNYYNQRTLILNAIATAAKTLADSAQSTADGKIVTFYQSGIPTATDVGDIFHDTDDGKTYRSTNIGDTLIQAGQWERIDTGLYPSLVDALQTTNAPADASATAGATFGTDVAGGGTANTQTDNDGYTTLFRQSLFGDGSTGDLTTSGDVTLTADAYYDDLTVTAGDTVYTAGFRLFVKGTLTNNGTISRNGTTGGNGGAGTYIINAGTAGAASTALASGSLQGAIAGLVGIVGRAGASRQAGGQTNGNAGVANTNTGVDVAKSLVDDDGNSGVSGGSGGSGTTNSKTGSGGGGGSGAAGGSKTGTVFNTIKNATAAFLMYDFLPSGDNLRSAPSNGGCGSSGSGGVSAANGNYSPVAYSGATGGSGGGGGQAGIVTIFAKKIINTGTISANGGLGGDAGITTQNSFADLDAGTAGVSDNCAAAGGSAGSPGGNGGNGGVLVLVYSSLTDTGTISVTGGVGGTGATGKSGVSFQKLPTYTASATNGADGNTGTTGNAGTLIQLEV